ncbi:hypothetical protein [Actinoplanes sp. L3-i22]|uniref:hypothetical protein n=1 Tax=Actinoplanes sp. L3-i22 TaxID=2836373 RepID=UPI001C84CCAE|nr:hypothetical protein [Actinoplanes sp. L3-i22]
MARTEPPGRDQPAIVAAVGGQPVQQLCGLPAGNLRAQVEPGGEESGLGETAQPALGQRNAFLDDVSIQCGDGRFVRPDRQPQRIAAADPGQGGVERLVDVDVGRAPRADFTIQSGVPHRSVEKADPR